jgi:two-component system cell cycle response regulator
MAADDRPAERQPTILVVDDDVLMLKVVSVALKRAGYGVVESQSGEEALAILKQGAVAGIVLDIMMPGMDGLEVCRRVKGDLATAHIPVVLVSALTGEGDLKRGFEAGADDYIKKPFEVAVLLEMVQDMVPALQ